MVVSVINDFRGPYRWLSNFELCDVYGYEDDGILYPSTEHAYQAAKSINIEVRKLFSKDTPPNAWLTNTNILGPWKQLTPGQAKKKGNNIEIRSDWESIKISVMRHVTKEKYKHDRLEQLLLDTYPAELIEGNTWKDTFWGVCNGVGENNLGKILMQERERLYILRYNSF